LSIKSNEFTPLPWIFKIFRVRFPWREVPWWTLFGPLFEVFLDSSQNFLWSPLQDFSRLKSKFPLIPLQDFSWLKSKYPLVPSLRFFSTQVKNFLWSPLWGFSQLKSKFSLVPPLRFSLKLLKNRGGGVNFYLGPPFKIFYWKIFPGGGYTLPAPPLRNTAFKSFNLASESRRSASPLESYAQMKISNFHVWLGYNFEVMYLWAKQKYTFDYFLSIFDSIYQNLNFIVHLFCIDLFI
jgi:hypothetical protein